MQTSYGRWVNIALRSWAFWMNFQRMKELQCADEAAQKRENVPECRMRGVFVRGRRVSGEGLLTLHQEKLF